MDRIIHISDTHCEHGELSISECDVLVHTGDIGGRTNINELTKFLIWFDAQPAKVKIFIAGNHDIVLDKKEAAKESAKGNIYGWSRQLDEYKRAMELIQAYNVVYLMNSGYEYEGIKFWGSPYSPSFHREYWAFNADRGAEISKHWAKIPNDVDILLTHSPCYGMLDLQEPKYRQANEDPHLGCSDLLAVIKKRLFGLKLHCSGHIHHNYGITQMPVNTVRSVLFSNGAVVGNNNGILITHPLIINI